MTGEVGDHRKGQNLETIISKLSKDQPEGNKNSFLLISGIDCSNVMLHLGSGNETDEEEESDLFQCGRCKQMFTVLQKYLGHKAAKHCSFHKNRVTSQVETDETQLQSDSKQIGKQPMTQKAFEPVPEENHFVNSSSKRKHERKGRARRIPSMSEAHTPSPTSPQTPPVLLHQEDQQPYRVTPDFQASGDPPLNGLQIDRSSSPDSSHSQHDRSHSLSPVYCRPTIYNTVSQGTSTGNPDSVPRTLASPVYQVHQPMSQPPPLLNGPVPTRLNQSWSVPTMAVGPRPGDPRAGLPLLLPRAVAGINKIPMRPIDVPIRELKERGRPIKQRVTGLTEEELTQEIIASSGQKIFRCKKCDKEFAFSSRLKRHLLVHTGARPFECEICYRRFTQAVDLKRHLLRHSGQKPHVCQFCGKQYTRADRLKVHLTTHTDPNNSSRPYICSRCNVGFDEAEQLQTHTCDPDNDELSPNEAKDTEGVLGSDGEKIEVPPSVSHQPPMGVNVTLGGAAVAEAVIVPRLSPMKVESPSSGDPAKPYKCEDCSASFTKSTSLKSHSLKHSGEKKYKCEHCAKTFFSSSSLKIHVRVHTGDRPFKCKECPRKFSDPSNFNKHKRWHAKQKGFGVPSPRQIRPSAGEEDRSVKRRKPNIAESAPSLVPVYGTRGSVIKKETELSRESSESLFDAGANTSNPVPVFGTRGNTVKIETDTNREPNENLFAVAGEKDVEEDGASAGFAAPEALVSMSSYEPARLKNTISESTGEDQ